MAAACVNKDERTRTMHEEHLKDWLRSVINVCRSTVGDLPSTPTITDELDQCLGRVEHELDYALTLIKIGNAFNEINNDED